MKLELNDELYSQLQTIVKDSTEFSDVSAYVTYILQQVVQKKQQAKQSVKADPAGYSKADEDKIRERLKNLGYLD